MQANMTTQYLHSIIDQNQQLRLRVSKLQQIQKYMEALLKKCELLEQQKLDFSEQLHSLLEQNSLLQRQLARINQSHKEEIKMVLLEHDSIMRKMQQQLKIIRIDYQRESQLSDELRQGKNLKQGQLKHLQQQFKAFTKQADKEISQLRQALIVNQKQYQILAEQNKFSKSQSLNEKEDLMKQLYHLKAVVGRQMKRHIQEIQMQNSSLNKQAEGLRKYNQEIARNATMREQQLTEEIKFLKDDFEVKQTLYKEKLSNFERSLLQKTQQSSKRLTEINHLIDENIYLNQQLQISLSNQNKFCFMLEQSQKQNQSLRQKLVQIDNYIRQESQKHKTEFFDQRNHNSELRKVLSDKEMLINEKLRQIKDLLNIIDQIQSALKMKDKQIEILRNQSEKIQDQLKLHLKNFQSKNLQWRTLDERNRSLKLSVQELQILNASLKKQMLQMQTTNHTLKRQLLNPRTSNKQNEQKIQYLVQSFRKQKQCLLHQHRIEIQKIKQTHQFQIRQKELQFLRKVDFFQEQLKRLT